MPILALGSDADLTASVPLGRGTGSIRRGNNKGQHIIRQNAAGIPPVLIRLLEVLARVLAVEARPDRHAALLRYADLALAAGRAGVEDAAGLADLERRHAEAG